MLPCKTVYGCTYVNLPTGCSLEQVQRSLVIVALKYVFNRCNVLNDRSHSTDVIGNVHKMRTLSNLCTFGKNSQSHSAKASTAVLGRSLAAFSHLRRKRKNSTSETWGHGRSST